MFSSIELLATSGISKDVAVPIVVDLEVSLEFHDGDTVEEILENSIEAVGIDNYIALKKIWLDE